MKNFLRKIFGYYGPLRLSEQEAWLILAERWKNPVEVPNWDKSIWYFSNVKGKAMCSGLCNDITTLMIQEKLSLDVADSMRSKIYKFAPSRYKKHGSYCWGHTKEDAKERYEFCKIMSVKATMEEH